MTEKPDHHAVAGFRFPDGIATKLRDTQKPGSRVISEEGRPVESNATRRLSVHRSAPVSFYILVCKIVI